jgi:class 3 adenylate cyclase
MRIGLHTGEIELRHDDIGGLTVHIAARVMGEAGSGQVLISHAVRGLLAGSDIAMEDSGVHVLKGIDGQWPLFAVTAL